MSDTTDSRPDTAGEPTAIIETNGVELAVTEAGAGPLVVLCHGFPELRHSWRRQIAPLAEAGYHVVAPDQRGYGRSSQPPAIEDYDIAHLTGDMAGLLDRYDADDAIFVGHDWGSMVVWAMAQHHPERVRAVCGMSMPFVPRGSMRPTEMLRAVMGDNFFYVLYFQEPIADENLAADPEAVLRGMMAGIAVGNSTEQLRDMISANDGRGLRERLPDPQSLPAWLRQADLDHYVAEFTRTGFGGGINWYRNLDRNWELSEPVADRKIEMPALFVGGAADPVLRMSPPAIMDGWVTDLRGTVVVEGAGHWVQQEKPDEVNAALLNWLSALD